MFMSLPLRACLVLAHLAVLTGCVAIPDITSISVSLPPGVPCADGGTAACFFRNAPVKLSAEQVRLDSRLLPYSTTVEDLTFVDGARRLWDAPRGTLSDGASIPILFQPFLGNPRDPLFVNAGVLHDAYCGIGNEGGPRYHADTWQNVHVMFFDALVVAGTPDITAKVMFAAVWLGGPRWGPRDSDRNAIPDSVLVAAFLDVRSYITADNPPLEDLIRRMTRIEYERFRAYAAGAAGEAGADVTADPGTVVDAPAAPAPAAPAPAPAAPAPAAPAPAAQDPVTPDPVIPDPVTPENPDTVISTPDTSDPVPPDPNGETPPADGIPEGTGKPTPHGGAQDAVQPDL